MRADRNRWGGAAALAALVLFFGCDAIQQAAEEMEAAERAEAGGSGGGGLSQDAVAEGRRTLQTLFAEGRSDVVVEARGTVSRILADDNEGSRHQRFIVQVADGQTILMVTHEEEIAEHTKRLIRMRDGKIEHDSTRH